MKITDKLKEVAKRISFKGDHFAVILGTGLFYMCMKVYTTFTLIGALEHALEFFKLAIYILFWTAFIISLKIRSKDYKYKKFMRRSVK